MTDKEIGRPTRPLFTTFPEKCVVHAFLELLRRTVFLIKFTLDVFVRASNFVH